MWIKIPDALYFNRRCLVLKLQTSHFEDDARVVAIFEDIDDETRESLVRSWLQNEYCPELDISKVNLVALRFCMMRRAMLVSLESSVFPSIDEGSQLPVITSKEALLDHLKTFDKQSVFEQSAAP